MRNNCAMTTTDDRDELLHAIARAMIDNINYDIIGDFMIDLRRRTNERDFDTLAAAFELCPIHLCDYRICDDDERTDCAARRA